MMVLSENTLKYWKVIDWYNTFETGKKLFFVSLLAKIKIFLESFFEQ